MGILDRFRDNGGNSTAVDDDIGSGLAVVNIDISRIESNPAQFRKHFDGLEDLATSIKEKGVRIPIKVSRRGDNYRIVYGERRWRAAKLAGLKLMPCIITSSTDENTDETCLIENLSRDALNIVDEAEAIREFDKRGYKLDGIARMIGKSIAYVSNYLKIGKFIEAAKNGGFMDYNEFAGLSLKYRHFLAVADMDDIDAGTRLLREAAEKHLTEIEIMDKAYLAAVDGETAERKKDAAVEVRPAMAITEYPLPVSEEPARTDTTAAKQVPSLTLPGIEVVEGMEAVRERVVEGPEAVVSAPAIEEKAGMRSGNDQTVFTGKAIEKTLTAFIASVAAVSKVSTTDTEFKIKKADRARLVDMTEDAADMLADLTVALSAIKDRLAGQLP